MDPGKTPDADKAYAIALERVAKDGPDVLGTEGHRDYNRMGRYTMEVTDILAAIQDVLRPSTLEELEDHGFREGP
ncbi:MAG: hypothetical protein K9H25_13940 [Rhodospirillum sp.]|nr:hypothetical protein [Rhodospirillum sp.]MCF8490127.1 hypothetical protein [Rhodospirillum sp.]MCF8501590.1 hypothetical protein [Rhodospirillum sp.]